MSRTKKIAILAIIAMVLTLMPAALFANTADSDRLAGADRIGTAIAIADAGWTTAGTVVLAPADQANLVDALAAAPLAGQENAPILLTFKGSLNADVKAKIAALGATKVYVVGAISDAVVAEVDAMAGVSAEKLAGANRWATADAINAKLVNPAGTFVVGYNAIPDALSVASYAAANKYAIVLANADGTVPAAKLVGDKTYLVGGTAVVKDYAGATRLAGADRFATNTAVFNGLNFGTGKVYVANGLSLVDALAVAPLAAKDGAFVALASATNVAAASAVNAKLDANSKVIAVGGVNAVSNAVKGQVGQAPAGTFAVSSVQLVNSKQLVIKFNKAIAKSSVIDGSDTLVDNLFTIQRLPGHGGLKDITPNTAKAELSSDKTTVTITAAGDQYFDGTYVVSIVADEIYTDGHTEYLKGYSTTVSINDQTAPTVTNVAYKAGSSQIEVTMSEPVEVFPSIRVNGGNTLGVTDSSKIGTRDKFVVNVDADLAGTTVQVAVSGASDYKANIMEPVTRSVTLSKEVGDVVVTSLTQKNSNTLTVVFNRAIKGNASEAQGLVESALTVLLPGATGFSGTITATRDSDDSSNKTFDIEFDTKAAGPSYSNLYDGKDTVRLTLNFAQDTLEDVFGNYNKDFDLSITMTRDKAAPTYQSVTVLRDSKEIRVQFNENISTSLDPAAAGVVLRKAGVPVANTVLSVDKNRLSITLVGDEKFDNGSYSIRFSKLSNRTDTVADVHGNLMASFTTPEFNVAATATESSVKVAQNGINNDANEDNVFIIGFTGKVGTSALNPSSYTLDGVTLPSGTDIYFSQTDKTEVTIVMPNESINRNATGNDGAILRVVNVRDEDGLKIAAAWDKVDIVDNTPPVLQTARLIGNTMILEFNEDMDDSIESVTALADLVKVFEIKRGISTLTTAAAGSTAVTVSVTGKTITILVHTIDPVQGVNWNTIAASGGTVTIKTLEPAQSQDRIVADENGVTMKKDIQKTFSRN